MPVPICHMIPVGDTLVPVGPEGQYLDWTCESETEAEPLTSPHGPRHFLVGDRLRFAVLDFYELPDGSIVVTADANDGMLHVEDASAVKGKDEVLAHAFWLIERLQDALAERLTAHDEEFHNSDRMYFLRSLGKFIEDGRYEKMDDHQLRGL